MTRTIPAVCIGLALASLSVAAQNQTPTPTAPNNASSQARGTHVTLTGCVKPWDASMAMPGSGTASNAPGRTPADAMYALTDVERSSSPTGASPNATMPGATSPGSASPGSMGDAMMRSTYLLKSTDASTNLSQHVNHKVAVTGTVTDSANAYTTMPGSSSSGSASTATPSTGATGTTSAGTPGTTGTSRMPGTSTAQSSPSSMPSSATPQTLTIASVQMIAATCSSGQ